MRGDVCLHYWTDKSEATGLSFARTSLCIILHAVIFAIFLISSICSSISHALYPTLF